MRRTIEESQRALFDEENEDFSQQHKDFQKRLEINPIIQASADKIVGTESVKNADGEYETQVKTERIEGTVDLRAVQSQVQKEIDLMNTYIFSDDVFEKEAALRKWIRAITGQRHMNISDAEELIKLAKVKDINDVFIFHGVKFIVNQLGMLDRFDRFIFSLESTIINLQKQNTVYNDIVNERNSLSFFGYIKLAFKTLFKGETNG